MVNERTAFRLLSRKFIVLPREINSSSREIRAVCFPRPRKSPFSYLTWRGALPAAFFSSFPRFLLISCQLAVQCHVRRKRAIKRS